MDSAVLFYTLTSQYIHFYLFATKAYTCLQHKPDTITLFGNS